MYKGAVDSNLTPPLLFCVKEQKFWKAGQENAHRLQSGHLTSLRIISKLVSSGLLWKWALLNAVLQVIGGDKPFPFSAFPSPRAEHVSAFISHLTPTSSPQRRGWAEGEASGETHTCSFPSSNNSHFFFYWALYFQHPLLHQIYLLRLL